MLPFLTRPLADRLLPASRAPGRTADDLDVPAVVAALGRTGDLSSVRTEVDHGTSQRTKVVLHWTDGSSTGVFVKNTPLRAGARMLDRAARLCEREADFYARVAPGVPSAPQALLAGWDPRTGRSVVALPDLAAAGYEFRPAADACTPDEVGLALDTLAGLHAATITAAGPVYVLDSPSMRRIGRLVGRRLGASPKSLAGLVPGDVLAQSAVLRTHAREYADVLAGFPQAFIHNDTHRGNIGFRPDRAVLIDWQNCGWGPALKDVAYLMVTALEPEDRRAHERALVERYCAAVATAGGEAQDVDEAWEAYRVLAITGYVAAAVTAMFRDRLQAAANSEAGVRRASAAVQDLGSFEALRERISPRRARGGPASR